MVLAFTDTIYFIFLFIVYLFTLILYYQYNWFCIFDHKCIFYFTILTMKLCIKYCMYDHSVLYIDYFNAFSEMTK